MLFEKEVQAIESRYCFPLFTVASCDTEEEKVGSSDIWRCVWIGFWTWPILGLLLGFLLSTLMIVNDSVAPSDWLIFIWTDPPMF